jgi:hypothetical protein
VSQAKTDFRDGRRGDLAALSRVSPAERPWKNAISAETLPVMDAPQRRSPERNGERHERSGQAGRIGPAAGRGDALPAHPAPGGPRRPTALTWQFGTSHCNLGTCLLSTSDADLVSAGMTEMLMVSMKNTAGKLVPMQKRRVVRISRVGRP